MAYSIASQNQKYEPRKYFSNKVVLGVKEDRTSRMWANNFAGWFQLMDGLLRKHTRCGYRPWWSTGLSLGIYRGPKPRRGERPAEQRAQFYGHAMHDPRGREAPRNVRR
jgi:hypothetical protein